MSYFKTPSFTPADDLTVLFFAVTLNPVTELLEIRLTVTEASKRALYDTAHR